VLLEGPHPEQTAHHANIVASIPPHDAGLMHCSAAEPWGACRLDGRLVSEHRHAHQAGQRPTAPKRCNCNPTPPHTCTATVNCDHIIALCTLMQPTTIHPQPSLQTRLPCPSLVMGVIPGGCCCCCCCCCCCWALSPRPPLHSPGALPPVAAAAVPRAAHMVHQGEAAGAAGPRPRHLEVCV
jgi:hypothetical protein